MPVEVIGLDRILMVVRSLERSVRFYDTLMGVLGFRKATERLDGAPHAHYRNGLYGFTLRPARERPSGLERMGPGPSPFCFRVNGAEEVNRAARELRDAGIETTEPALWPQSDPDCYAIFLSDPDGIRLEIVNDPRARLLRWDAAGIGDDPQEAARRVNAARRAGSPDDPDGDLVFEQAVDRRWGAGRRLAAYGSLLPGRENHRVVAALRGTWYEGAVQGELVAQGWGAASGYPGIRLVEGGGVIRVKVLVSDDLPMAWRRIDAFEGSDYRRVLAFVTTEGPTLLANIYELSESAEAASRETTRRRTPRRPIRRGR